MQKLARLEDAGIGSLPQQAPMNLDEQAELARAVARRIALGYDGTRLQAVFHAWREGAAEEKLVRTA